MQAPNVRLIKTKLRSPAIAADVVPRPRLLQRLARTQTRKLTLISAPAGTGKTTLVVQWLAQDPRPVAWYSLDQSDSNLSSFFTYLVAAIQSVYPSACAGAAAFVHASTEPPPDHLAAHLINELAELPGDLVLVLDDYHFVRDAAVHDLLTNFIAHQPPQVHLVIATRTEPPLPLSALRAAGQMVELRMIDLRFQSAEILEFVEKTIEHPVPAMLLPVLDKQTEGWGVGIRLAALSLLSAESEQEIQSLAANLEQTQRHVLDYLMDEVLARQSPEIQRFLLRTSVLERMCAPLCATLLAPASVSEQDGPDSLPEVEPRARDHAQQMLERIEAANLFVVSLDAGRKWYRYHALFRELLATRLQSTAPATDHAHLHRRAARWLARNGYVEEGLAHALAGDDRRLAAEIVEEAVPGLLNQLDRPALDRLIGMLPSDLVEQRPALLLAKAWSYHFVLGLRSIPPLLEGARRLLQDATPEQRAALRGQILTGETAEAYAQLQTQRAIEIGRKALETLPPGHAFLRGIAHIYLCGALQTAGQMDEAMRCTNAALEQHAGEFDAYVLRLVMTRAMLPLVAGQWTQTQEWGRVCVEQSRRHGLQVGLGWGHWVVGTAAMEQWQPDAALQSFAAAMELTYTAHLRPVVDSHLASALIHELRGESARADACLRAAAELETVYASPGIGNHVRSCRARVALIRGDADGAARLLATLGEIEVPSQALLEFEVPAITAARVLVARAAPDGLARTQAFLADLLAFVRRYHFARYEPDLLLLRALLLAKDGQAAESLAAAREGVLLAESMQSLRPLLESGAALVPLLRNLLGRGVAPALINRALAAMPGQARAEGVDPLLANRRLVEPLTNREMDVLELLAHRLSNKEIAESLFVAPSTIQTHLTNVFQKLNACNRREAVMRAREIGILG